MSSIRAQERKAKTIFSLEAPLALAPPQWPVLTAEESSNIMDLLTNLLQPIGDHKRLLRNTEKEAQQQQQQNQEVKQKKKKRKRSDATSTEVQHILEPFLTIGFNTTTSSLESMAQKHLSKRMPAHLRNSKTTPKPVLSAVFVSRSDSQPTALHAHLPISCALAKVPLIQLPRGSEVLLSKYLDTTRVATVGIVESAPGANGLLGFIKANGVGRVELPSWLADPSNMKWQETKINAIQTTAPVVSKKQKKNVTS